MPDALLPVLQQMARSRGMSDIGAVLRKLTEAQLGRMQRRAADPVVGALHTGISDLSTRDEDLLADGWQPD